MPSVSHSSDKLQKLQNTVRRLQDGEELTPLELAVQNLELIGGLYSSLDNGWTIVAGCLVFLMHLGFTLLESGAVRTKNKMNIVMKNVITLAISAGAWWVLGYGLAFGESDSNKLYGTDSFLMRHDDLKTDGEGSFLYAFWFFQFTFCATAATIVSGALAERARIEGYVLYTLMMCAVIYPVVVHWTWGGGWLAEEGYSDFAGSGVVHMTGGFSALVGAIILGPRKSRFDQAVVDSGEFAPGDFVNLWSGTLILWFGWYGFNAGSTVALSGSNAEVAGHCATTTTLSAAWGGIVSFVLFSLRAKKYDLGALGNGVLAGLVGITAGCWNIDTPEACLVGAIAGVILFAVVTLLDVIGFQSSLKIDDPLGAFAVHGACGAWGVIAVGLFDIDGGMITASESFDTVMKANIYGVAAIAAWSMATSSAVFGVLKVAGILRVHEDVETYGLDSELMFGLNDKKSTVTTSSDEAVKDDGVKEIAEGELASTNGKA